MCFWLVAVNLADFLILALLQCRACGVPCSLMKSRQLLCPLFSVLMGQKFVMCEVVPKQTCAQLSPQRLLQLAKKVSVQFGRGHLDCVRHCGGFWK